jgi:tricorn protease
VTEPSYLRFPSVRGDLLAFVADDDVWLAPAAGGTARRLTADRAPVAFASLSPDGAWVAYASRRDGRPEVFLVSTVGEDVRRLTYLGDDWTHPLGWTVDGRVLLVSAAGEPFRSRTWAYSVAVDGSGLERLPYGPISALSTGPGGAVVLGVNQSLRRGASWKRYRGGTAAALWIDRDGGGEFAPYLTDLRGQLEDPVFVGERVAFVSDHEGYGNVYSALPDGSDLRRHSDHADFYARAASSDGRAVVYQCAGELYRIDELAPDSTPVRIEVVLGAPRSGRLVHSLKAAEVLGEHAPDHDGRASAVETRGEIHWLTHEKGPARLLGGGKGVRARLPAAVGTGESAKVLFVTDAEGEDAIELVPAHGSLPDDRRRIGAGALGRVLDLAVSPDGTQAAVATHDGRVVLVGLDGGDLRTVSTSEHGDASGLTFSPDSGFVAWSEAGPDPLRHIKLAEVATGDVVEVTPLRFVDDEPVFSADGKYLAFLSARTFDPLYDAFVFDLSFVAGVRPYLVSLAAATTSPFDAEPKGRPRHGAAEAEAKREHGENDTGAEKPDVTGDLAGSGGGSETASRDQETDGERHAGRDDARDDQRTEEGEGAAGGREPTGVRIDRDGLAERVVPFPVAAGRYAQLRAAHDGFLWLSEPIEGVLGEGRAGIGAKPARAWLVRFDLVMGHESHLVDALDSYDVSGDGRTVVVRDGGQLRALPADHRVETSPHGEPSPDVVEIDLSRVRIEVDPPREWAQMYDEAAKLMRDHFWVADMAGVDWEGVVTRYRPLLDRIATRDDLSELLWEVQGELGASHAYETPPPRPAEEERALGLLGADLERDAEGTWRVARLLPGESSVLSARAPLLAPGAGIAPGDAILAVDGRPVDPVFGPTAGLVGAAEKPVELTVRSGSGSTREVVVEPLGDERALRYQRWVAGRREYVHAATDGRVGYVHIPDMIATGWAELHRDLRVEVTREALVVDVRDNRGGHTSSLVLETLGRTVRAWDVGRHIGPMTYPPNAPRGPRVLVTNEQAGSDGDIVTAGFRQLGLGPIVGTRTWGGVIGIDSRYTLVDGTSVTQPRYSFWFTDLGWGVENHGVEPDVEVPEAPQDWAAGNDPQLDRAIALVLEALVRTPAAVPPDVATRPSRVPPPLPPRPS